jgi:probable HAF family extracellular repeat protein
MNRSTRAALLAALAAAVFAGMGGGTAALAQTTYGVTRIPLPAGASDGRGRDVNRHGEVLGSSSAGLFYWKAGVNGGKPISIPNPPGDTGTATAHRLNDNGYVIASTPSSVFVWKYGVNANQSLALNPRPGGDGPQAALNNADQIVSHRQVMVEGGIVRHRACAWEKDASGVWILAELPPLPGDDTSRAYALSDNGLAVGVSYITADPAGSWWPPAEPMRLVAWRKDAAGAWQPIAIPAQIPDAFAYQVSGVNDAGQATGIWYNGATEAETPFFLDVNAATIVSIGTFGGAKSRVHGLNAYGQVAGWADGVDSPYYSRRAFTWDPTRGADNPLSLGTLGGSNSRAGADLYYRAINDAGYVVGVSLTSRDKASHGFVWDAARGMRDLNNITPNKAGFSELYGATAVGQSGHIVGQGIAKGVGQAYLLTPNP